jgi:RNA polymerase sigma-70 factor (ECF subfamily)
VETAEEFPPERQKCSPGTLGDVLYANTKPSISEAEWVALVRAVASGDQAALHALYARAHRLVFTLAVRIAGNRETAEELTLDVFHDIWRRAAQYDPANGTVLGWIMNQARSRAIDRMRFDQRKKRVQSEIETPPMAEPVDPRDLVAQKQQNGALRSALAVLSVQERSAIEAAFFSELTYAEVAARLDEPLGTVKTRIRSGLHKLRQALAGEGNNA